MQARFYLPWVGRFGSPDPARDQHFEQTQSWNIYSYVQNSPTMQVDPTGMVGEGWEQFKAGFTNRLINNATLNIPETLHEAAGIGPAPPSSTTASNLGALAADLVGVVGGTAEVGAGTGGGILTSPSGVGALAGAAVAVHGVATVATSLYNTIGDTKALVESSRSTSSPGGSETKPEPHGNTADDRPATRYEKYDKDGNFEKHGITKHEDPSKRYTKKQIDGGKVVAKERGPRTEMLKKERDLVERKPGPKNREPWAGKRSGE